MPTNSLLDRIKNPKLKEFLRRLPRHVLQETKEIVLEPDSFYLWTKRERKQFIDALRITDGSYFECHINEKKLPKRHPAIRRGYSEGDLTSAYLALIEEAGKTDRNKSSNYLIQSSRVSVA